MSIKRMQPTPSAPLISDVRQPSPADAENGVLMSETILVGRDLDISTLPRQEWEEQLTQAPARIRARLSFMSNDHHLVRNHVVRELPRLGRPLPAAEISHALGLPMPRTDQILTDLEERLFFLVRDHSGNVSWAFPVTVDNTGHHLLFSTGERLDAA